jgi:hypothetical protein
MSDQEIVKSKKKYTYPKEQIQIYNDKFKTKHANELIKCQICFKEYSFLNKGYHSRSKHHLIAMQIRESLSTTMDNPGMDGSDQEKECKGGIF